MQTMRSPSDIASLLRERQCYVVQHMGDTRYEVWIDGDMKGVFTDVFETETCIREQLGISVEEGELLDRYAESIARGLVHAEAN